MRQLFLLLCIPLIHSCSDKKGDSGYNFKYDKTSLGTLKEEYRTTFEIPYNYTAKVVFVKKHKEEVLKNFGSS